MQRSERYPKGRGNNAYYIRLRGVALNFYDWVAAAYVSSETDDSKSFGIEVGDRSPSESGYYFTFAPPTGNYKLEIVDNETGEVVSDEDVFAASSALGIITGVADLGVSISPIFVPIVMEKGENKVIQRQIIANGVPKDCSAYTFKLGIKESITDTTYKIGINNGVVSNDTNGVPSIVTYTIAPAATSALAPFAGKYSEAMYDGSNKGVVLNPGGTDYRLLENIID